VEEAKEIGIEKALEKTKQMHQIYQKNRFKDLYITPTTNLFPMI